MTLPADTSDTSDTSVSSITAASADQRPADPGRRSFVRQMAWGGVALGALPLAACGGDDDAPPVQFLHGVASGDPLSDRVILWTRLAPPAGDTRDIPVQWEVASDAAFSAIVAQGQATAAAGRDFTVKVDAAGLKAATGYYYRFRAYDATSPTGRTRTLPTGSVAQVKLAVFSCANYPAGYFNVYADAARRSDVDAAVHLGDYIYEYGRDGYASAQAAQLGRLSQPAGEIITLADYRQRYAQYRSDPDLQALHAAMPMIAVWDDHEIANDSWTGGAENHQSATEGDYAQRKAAAQQAYHEWLPTRNAQPALIYRSFAFGDLLALHMLDTRHIGRDKQLDYTQFMTPQGLDAAAFTAALGDPTRQLLGAQQTQWLQQQLGASGATWQVLGQQVLMGRMNVPAPILMDVLAPGSGVSVSAYAALVAKAQQNPAALTPQEQAILAQPAIPYNLDAWDGYAAARETMLGLARALQKNLVVLGGDTHDAWANELQDLQGNPVGVEFAASSVSSPGFEEILPSEDPAMLAGAFQQLIPTLKYADTSRRGYLLLTATPGECRGDWVFVDTITSRNYRASTDKSLKVLPGAAGRGRLVAA